MSGKEARHAEVGVAEKLNLVYAVIIAFLGAPEFLLPPPPKFAGKASTPPATAITAITWPFY
jgi:hypothetical protein